MGTLADFRQANENDPDHTNLMVAGPWAHGSWRRSVSSVGVMQLGQDTALAFRKDIEAPFFAYWLHDKGAKPEWAASTFQTGSNVWKTYAAWPPATAKATSVFLHADGSLTFTRRRLRRKQLHAASCRIPPIPSLTARGRSRPRIRAATGVTGSPSINASSTGAPMC